MMSKQVDLVVGLPSRFLSSSIAISLILYVGVLQSSPIKAVQMIWVNLLQDTLASLSLATELPSDDLLRRKPYGRNQNIVSPIMLRNIISHSVYQLLILFCMLFAGIDSVPVSVLLQADVLIMKFYGRFTSCTFRPRLDVSLLGHLALFWTFRSIPRAWTLNHSSLWTARLYMMFAVHTSSASETVQGRNVQLRPQPTRQTSWKLVANPG